MRDGDVCSSTASVQKSSATMRFNLVAVAFTAREMQSPCTPLPCQEMQSPRSHLHCKEMQSPRSGLRCKEKNSVSWQLECVELVGNLEFSPIETCRACSACFDRAAYNQGDFGVSQER